VITGIGLAEGGRLFVPRPYLRKLRGFIHRATSNEEKRSLRGMMSFFEGVTKANPTMNKIERKVWNEFQQLIRTH